MENDFLDVFFSKMTLQYFVKVLPVCMQCYFFLKFSDGGKKGLIQVPGILQCTGWKLTILEFPWRFAFPGCFCFVDAKHTIRTAASRLDNFPLLLLSCVCDDDGLRVVVFHFNLLKGKYIQ